MYRSFTVEDSFPLLSRAANLSTCSCCCFGSKDVVVAVPTVLALKLSLAWQHRLHAVVVVAVGPAAGAVAIHPAGTGLEGG